MKKNLLLAILVLTINAFAQISVPISSQILSKDAKTEINDRFRSSNSVMKTFSVYSSELQSVLNTASLQRLDSAFSASWDPYTKSWGYATTMNIYNYSSKGTVTSILAKKLNNGKWSIDNQTILSYDATDHLTSSSTQFYSAGTWFETARTTNTYDSNGQMTNTIILGLNFNTFLLDNKYQIVNTYDANKNQTGMLYKEWKADAWVTIYEYNYSFDDNSNMTSWLFRWWDSGIIAAGEKYIATYNANNEITDYISQMWDATSNTWVNSSRLVNFVLNNNNAAVLRITQESMKYTYSTPIFIKNKSTFSSYTLQKWVAGAWVDATKYDPVFDSNNNLTSATIKTWTNGLWKDYINWTCTYDANKNLISTTDDTWNVVYWMKRRTYNTYDANKNVTSSIGQTFQNGNVGDWVHASTTYTTFDASNAVISKSNRLYILDGKMTTNSGDSIYNYYHVGIAGVNEMKMTEKGVSVYPNPSNGKFKINSDTKTVNSIEIYNLTGNKIYSNAHLNQLEAGEIDLSTAPKGVYFLRINKAGSGRSTKIIIQ